MAVLVYLDKNLDKRKNILYKPAKIYNAGGDLSATWFVHFNCRKKITHQFQRIKITGNINRINDAELRHEAAKILRRVVNQALDNGWEPLGEPVEPVIQYSYTIFTAINEMLTSKTKTLRGSTAISYKSRVGMFCDWLKKRNLHNLDVKDFQPLHAQKYTDYLFNKNNNAKTVNGTNETLRGLFTKMVKLKLIPENPYNAIERFKIEESNWFAPLTDEEITAVAKHLRETRPELFVFMCFIYYSFMRPLSIVQLTADNFDFTGRIIYLEGKQHKNRKGTVKQMLQPLYDILVQYGYDQLKTGQFFFSTGLRPGQKKISPKRASGYWNDDVIKGLGINKKLYAVKHTGGSNYLTDNADAIDLSWLQKQMGHSSLEETEVYVKKRTVKKIDESRVSFRKL